MPNNRYVLLVGALFFLSGLSSLIYQVVWTRSMVFVFGSTQFATSTVLSVFMAGLALGSYVSGKAIDKYRFNPLLAYGILEAFIGVWALLAPLLFNCSIPLYKTCFDSLHLNPILFALLRFSVASVILLPPTTCMGATLPILSKHVTRNIQLAGNTVGTLYALNTLGAVVGSMFAGFFLLPSIGLSASTLLAAAINFVLLLAVLIAYKYMSSTAMPELAAEPATTPVESKSELALQTKVVLLSFFVSGALAMVYEVAWTRILLMLIGSTTYAFTLMLSSFLLGIFLGSLICARLVEKIKAPLACFALGEIYLCFAGLYSLAIFNYLPYLNLQISSQIAQSELVSMILRFSAAAMVLMPITLCLGALFPIVVRLCAHDLNKIAGSVGQLYAMNTCGAIVGSIIAGFFAIPILGAEQAIVLTSIMNLFLGVGLLFYSKTKPALKLLSLAAGLALLVWGLGAPQLLDRTIMLFAQYERRALVASGASSKASSLPSFEMWKRSLNHEIAFFKDGMCASVAVAKFNKPLKTLLFTNGHCDASDGIDMQNQAMLALLPLLVHPTAKDVCNVGWGSGVTVGYALRYPIDKLICAEIEPAVLDASKFFSHVNFQAESDKRAILEPSDGRNYLLCSPKKFDVIISEPSNPWQTGVCNLFTKEYFSIVSSSLADDGIFAMWCQLSEVSPKNLEEILLALRSVFPSIYLFDSGSGDMCAIVSKHPHKLSLQKLKEALANESVKKYYSQFGTLDAEDIISRIFVCPQGIQSLTATYKPNSDDLNYLEFDVAKSYETKRYQSEDRNWLFSHAGPIWDSIDYGSDDKKEKAREMAAVGVSCLSRDIRRGQLWLEKSLELEPTPVALSALIELNILTGNNGAVEALQLQADKLFPEEPRFANLKALILVRKAKYAEARALLKRAIAADPSKLLYKLRLAETYSPINLMPENMYFLPPQDADNKEVLNFAEALSADPSFLAKHESAYLVLADAYLNAGQSEKTIKLLQGLKNTSVDWRIWNYLARAYRMEHNENNARLCLANAAQLSQLCFLRNLEAAKQSMASGNEEEAVSHLQRCVEVDAQVPSVKNMLSQLAKNNEHARLLLTQSSVTNDGNKDNGSQRK